MKKILASLIFISLISFGIIAGAETEQEKLEAQIREKTIMLQEIEKQKQEVEKVLQETNKSNKKLSDEIKGMNATISQLNLSIRQNTVTIEKLNLEITSLDRDIISAEENIELKKETIAKLFVELQQKGNINFLSIFLKNKNLSDAIAEKQSIESINSSLKDSLYELHALKGNLSEKVEVEKDKKDNREVEQKNLENRQYIVADQKEDKQVLLKVTKNQEEIYQDRLTKLEELQSEVLAEIEDIESKLRGQIDSKLLPGKGVLEHPLPRAPITQEYGATAFARQTYKSKFHNGIDFGAPVGTPILSAEEGIIIAVGDQDKYCYKGAYGKFVLIKHRNGLTTLYAHLSRYIVSPAQRVNRGEIIGYIGNSGLSTGPHLHFTVFATNTIPPASSGFPEGTQASRVCGPMPVGGSLNPIQYISN